MDAVIAKIDPVIDRMEKSLEKIELYQNKKAKLPGAELDLLKQLEDARDTMNDLMKKTANDREQLEIVFGGDCMRIRRILAVMAVLDEKPLSAMNKNDQRLKGAHDASDAVIKVLEDMGYGWLLRSKVTYGDASGAPFKGNAFTVGTPIKPIKPQSGDFNKFVIDKPLPAGLTMNPATGEISGTPTAHSPTTEYSVSCQGAGKPVDCKLSITVLPKPVVPPVIGYVPPNQVYTQGKEIEKWSPKLISGAPPTEYTIVPVLPAGLNFDKKTGNITGTPTALIEQSPYTVTAKNAGGSNSCKISVEVVPERKSDFSFLEMYLALMPWTSIVSTPGGPTDALRLTLQGSSLCPSTTSTHDLILLNPVVSASVSPLHVLSTDAMDLSHKYASNR